MADPLQPDPRSPEGRMIAYAIEKGYLKRLDLEEARIKLSGHPAGREPGALLRLLRSRYLDPGHLEELRRYYQRTKAEIVRAAEEAQLEVLSISDILVGPPFSISDTGEVEIHEGIGSSDRQQALPSDPRPRTAQPARTAAAARPGAAARPAAGRPAAGRPAAAVAEPAAPADEADAPGWPRWLLPAVVAAVVAVAAVAAWLNAG